MKILLVEDEHSLGETISGYLRQEGYVCEWARNFISAEEKVDLYTYDCALIDISLPDGNGLDIVKSIKKSQPQAGIIIISAKNSVDDKISGLDLGADDYLTKPFHLSELNSRIRSLQRRRNFEGNTEMQVGDLKIIPSQHEVWFQQKELGLTKKEFALLLFFVSNKNRVISKEAIAEHLWGDEADALDSFDFVYSHIKNLRKKIHAVGAADAFTSIYGIGYKLIDT